MIDLEDSQTRRIIGAAISKRIQPGAQEHILADPAGHRVAKTILRETAADGQEGAQPRRARQNVAGFAPAQGPFGLPADDPKGQRVAKDRWAVQQLMRRPMHGGALGGGAGPILKHASVPRFSFRTMAELALALDPRMVKLSVRPHKPRGSW